MGAMLLTRRTLLLTATILFSGCAPQPVADSEALAITAERFVDALAEVDGLALVSWVRPDTPVALTRRCPACPSNRRVLSTVLEDARSVEAFGARVSQGAQASDDPKVSVLSVGTRRCAQACCSWEVSMLDHGATHLESACFGLDDLGPYVLSLAVVDG